jgi:RNA polymerase sigma-70 factor (ECF subfamily)
VAAVPVAGDEPSRLTAAAAGDRAALDWLLDDVAPVVYGFVHTRVGGDDGVAEDLLQETLLEMVRSAGSFRGESAASTWACAIARRCLARHYERERRAEVARAQLSLVVADDAAAAVERRDEITRALGRLPALHRQALVMKYLDDMSVEQIAAETHRSRVQVQSLLQRARDGLRRELAGADREAPDA